MDRLRKFIDFKVMNPYSAKDIEFEAIPTPKARTDSNETI